MRHQDGVWWLWVLLGLNVLIFLPAGFVCGLLLSDQASRHSSGADAWNLAWYISSRYAAISLSAIVGSVLLLRGVRWGAWLIIGAVLVVWAMRIFEHVGFNLLVDLPFIANLLGGFLALQEFGRE